MHQTGRNTVMENQGKTAFEQWTRNVETYRDAVAAFTRAARICGPTQIAPVKTAIRDGEVETVRKDMGRASTESAGVMQRFDACLLTPREREIAILIAHGLRNRQIGNALVITSGTVANHVANILGRLGLRSRTQIAVWALQTGLIEAGGVDVLDEVGEPHAA